MHRAPGHVLVVGSINADLVVRVERLPAPGETVLGSAFATVPGGKGANQAVAASRAGAQVAMVGRVGPDELGAAMTANLAANGVAVSGVGVCKHDPTGVALIEVDDAGENRIVVVAGANAKLRPEHVIDVVGADAFGGAAVVLAQLEVPVDAVLAAFTAARAASVTTMLNAAPAPASADAVAALLACTDVLVVNEHEAARLGGEAALAGLVPLLVVTLGAAGMRWHEHGRAAGALDALPVTPVDTTGAGDACCAVLAAALAAGRPTAEAMRRANAAGALATTRAGAQGALPTSDEIDAALR